MAKTPAMSAVAHKAGAPFLFALAALRLPGILPRSSAMKTFLAFIGLLAILCVIAAAVFFFGGFYNVAATSEDPGLVNSALANIRLASIRRHATDTPPMSLDDAATVQAGARAPLGRAAVDWPCPPGEELGPLS